MQELAEVSLMADENFEKQRMAARAELDNLLARGIVRPVFLFPAMLGGTDDPRNVICLPPVCIREKDQFEELVGAAVKQGETVHYTATPSYDGPSKVPARPTLTAQGTELNISRVIEVEPYK